MADTYVRGTLASDPLRNFRFVAKFEPLGGNGNNPTFSPTLGFTSISGLNISTESIPYREGQHNTTVRQIPGQTTFSPITMQRGVVLGSKQNWQWMEMLFRVNDNSSKRMLDPVKDPFRFKVSISVLAHPVRYGEGDNNANNAYDAAGNRSTALSDDKVAMKFTVFNAWPTSVAYSDLNAGDNALIVEQLTLVHEGFDVSWASQKADGTPDWL